MGGGLFSILEMPGVIEVTISSGKQQMHKTEFRVHPGEAECCIRAATVLFVYCSNTVLRVLHKSNCKGKPETQNSKLTHLSSRIACYLCIPVGPANRWEDK